jgi:hypothetical protein
MRWISLALATMLVLPACAADSSEDGGAGADGGGGGDDGGEDGGSDDGGDGGDDGGTSGGDGGGDDGGDGGTGGDDGGTGDDGDDGGTGDDGGNNEPPPATGIQIVDVTADQGIRVPVAVNGQLVPGNQRNQALLASRPLLLRAFYEVDPGFAQRSIYAVLTLEHGDGTTAELTAFETAHDQGCDPGQPKYECGYRSLINSFNFVVPEEEIREGVYYSIALYETAPGHENDVSDKVPVFPADGGMMILGVEERYMKMRVMFVPFKHDVGAECAEAPDLNAPFAGDESMTKADYLAGRLMGMNPTDEVTGEVHSVINFTGDMSGSSGLLNRLQQLRSQDGAPPWYYYYGLAIPCQGGPSFSGVSLMGGPSKSQASRRVSWGVWHGSLSTTGSTFVHEVGHQQGRPHIYCSGEEAGSDPSYPDHPEGDTESWGANVIGSIDIHPPEDHDYMTYCPSTWVSEWGWNLVFPWIAEISSWENEDGSGEKPRKLLLGRITADGGSEWSVIEGYFDSVEASPQHAVEFFGKSGGLVARTNAVYERYDKSDDYSVIVPVPDEFAAVTKLEWVDSGVRHAIDRKAIDLALPIRSE